jgi:serine/threonine-protein kinase
MPLNNGEIIDRYKIVKYLNSGKAGDVYLVNDINFPKNQLAMKIFNPWVLERSYEYERIKLEAEVGKSLNCKNLVKIFDVKINKNTPNGTFLIMEYIDGITLNKWIEKNKPIKINTFIKIALQLCKAIKILHESKIIHRDIKSSNIIYSKDKNVVLMDFGVAKLEHQHTITDSDEFLGTIAYSSPEYLFGNDYDYRTDLYSLGCVFYHMLSGKEPYSEFGIFSRKVVAKRESPPVLNSKKNCSVKRLICEELTKNLISNNPWDRLDNCDEILNILNDMEKSDWWLNFLINDPINKRKEFFSRYNALNSDTKIYVLNKLKTNLEFFSNRYGYLLIKDFFNEMKETETDQKNKEIINNIFVEAEKINNKIIQQIISEDGGGNSH